MSDYYDSLPTTGNPAADTLHVLQRLRELRPTPREAFFHFVAGSITHTLTLSGSNFSDQDILRALHAMASRSPNLFHFKPTRQRLA